MKTKSKRHRILFVALTAGIHIRICEQLPDGSLRGLLWSKLTKGERRHGDEFVKLLAPDPKGGFCAWRSPNPPKTVEDAKALQMFVAAIESRHGMGIWVK